MAVLQGDRQKWLIVMSVGSWMKRCPSNGSCWPGRMSCSQSPRASPYRDVIERNREWLAAAIDEAEARRAGGSTIRSAHRPSPDSARRMMDKALAMQERVASRVAAAKRPAPVSGGVEDPAVR